jgi:hypothetical protein
VEIKFAPSWSISTQWWWILPLSIPAQIRFIVLQTIARTGRAVDDLAGVAFHSEFARTSQSGGRVVRGRRAAKPLQPRMAAN